jgi:acetyl esterase/lipase
VFLHGWGSTPAAYRAWIDHLADRGSVVIAPQYQRTVAEPPPQVLPSAVIGVRSALARTPGLTGLVTAGHSAGGALAADLAAVAPAAGIPRPRAVFSVYPGRSLRGVFARIPPAPLRTIPRTTRVEAWAGDDDRVVGTATAKEIARAAHGRYRLVDDDAIDDHAAPQSDARAARRAFWRRLDELVAGARGS